jgi:AcrR family transcriptional regulator
METIERSKSSMSKGQQTREKIIQVATKHFFKFGLYRVTYQGIAEEVGLTQPAIYKYFQDMDELFLECCKYWDQKAREQIYGKGEKLGPADIQLKEYVQGHFRYSEKHRSHDSLVFGLYYYAMRSASMYKYYSELKATGVKNLARIFEFGNIDRSWKIEDPLQLAQTAHSLIAGEIFKFLIDPKDEKVEKRSQRVLAAFHKLISPD